LSQGYYANNPLTVASLFPREILKLIDPSMIKPCGRPENLVEHPHDKFVAINGTIDLGPKGTVTFTNVVLDSFNTWCNERTPSSSIVIKKGPDTFRTVRGFFQLNGNWLDYHSENPEATVAASYMLDAWEAIIDAKEKPQEKPVPKNGSKAYSRYHGYDLEGVLADISQMPDGRYTGKLVPEADKQKWNFHSDFPGIFVGYDERIEWDENRKMFRAPADYD
jgi:hypothetical protein